MTKETAIRILTGDALGTNEETKEAVSMAVEALLNPEGYENTKSDAQPETCEYWDNESNYCTLNRPSAEPEQRMRLIDANALLERAVSHGWSTPLWVSDIMIEDAPTIDAVEVVRCRECKHLDKLNNRCNVWHQVVYMWFDFCARAETRE